MSLKAGIVGLPNVGKSTLFSALTKKQVEAQNYAFTTIEPNISLVALKDPRIDKLAELINPKKVVYATFDFVDIAGLVEGASKGEGLGNKFLSNIREVDAIIHVVRCFENKNIMHVANSVDPARDQKIINLELILADLETINNVLHRVEKKAKSGDKVAQIEKEAAIKIKAKLESEKPARDVELTEEELKIIKGYQLLTLKPIIYVANLSNEQIIDYKNDPLFNALKNSLEPQTTIIPISVQMESELIQIEDTNEAKEFLSMYNVERSGLDILTRESFNLLDLETYFTAGEVEVRAWVYNKGMLAPQCAGIIHSDFEKKFIKAEVISYNDFIENNGELGAKAAGKMRQEGKNYIMQDGDICHFRFGK